MAAADRQVRHLRLQAPSADAVHALLPRLEDALRCASLPGQDSRLYLVRRLDLGRVARDVTPQALSLLIERRMAAQGGAWVDGGTVAADEADHVAFASRLDVRIRLALRLLHDAPVDAWYWPPAVPEFTAPLGRDANLARIAQTLARLPEARVALPAWLAALHADAAGAAWLAQIEPAQGVALLRQAGIAVPDAPREYAKAGAQTVETFTRDSDASTFGDDTARDAPAAWLHAALVLADAMTLEPRAPERQPTATRQTGIATPSAPSPLSAPASETAQPTATQPFTPADTLAPAGAPRAPARPAPAESPVTTDDATSDAAALLEQASPASAEPSLAEPYLDPTAAGGLLFLLPVMARLGLAQWLPEHNVGAFARRILHIALTRLAVPETDPAWALALPLSEDRQSHTAAAPAIWSAPLLATHDGQIPLAEALSQAANIDAQAALWLATARRWLRRAGRIGLAGLVLRPARLSLTPTHVDLHFRLQDTDLRVRRLGLDVDPGWLPWFGRVVSFHYLDTQP